MTEKEKDLLNRIAHLIGGDWSGTIFDGRDMKSIIELITAGKLEEAEKKIERYEKYYKTEL